MPFLLCFTLYLRAIFQVQAPGGGGGGLCLEGRFNGGFFALVVWGAYFLTSTVSVAKEPQGGERGKKLAEATLMHEQCSMKEN